MRGPGDPHDSRSGERRYLWERRKSAGQSFCGFGPHAEVGVGLGEDYASSGTDDIGGGQGNRQLVSPLMKGTLTMIER